ncbi:hypothetical protein [Sneathiella limimaris]|uniref:hypothetical protein n=1 Tax=Sneathiella limimaris TaxID=1964213 RepID=UPI00146DEC36|nr:hypothetical protein [Sneathiella limimaris]
MKKTLRTFAVLMGPLFVSACGGNFSTDLFGSDQAPLPCPNVTVLPGAENITIFREGPGRDLVDVTFEGVIEPIGGECVYEDDDALVVAELLLQVSVVKGPAANTETPTVPFFVAIADRDKKVLSKKVFDTTIQIPAGQKRGAVQEEMIQRIPILSGRTGADYAIVIGFQLSGEQLEYNRKTIR